MKAKLLFSAAGALALAACGSDTEPAPPDEALTEDALANPAETIAPVMTAQAFVDAVAASDLYEIEAGRLAESGATSEEVKDFGAMMVEAHSTSTADLRAAATGLAGVAVDPQLTPGQEADLEALRNAGASFDSAFARQQVAAHEAALQLLRDYGTNGDSAPLRAFASEAASVVESHLVGAQELP